MTGIASVVGQINRLMEKVRPYQEIVRTLNEEGKVLMSLADYYHLSKSLVSKNQGLTGAVNEGMGESLTIGEMLSSTEIICTKDKAKIVNYSGSKVINPSEREVCLPDFEEMQEVTAVLRDKNGLKFMQSLFNTRDSSLEIKCNLDEFKNSDRDLRISVPKYSKRGTKNYRCLFYFGESFFEMFPAILLCDYDKTNKLDGLPVVIEGEPKGIYRKRGGDK